VVQSRYMKDFLHVVWRWVRSPLLVAGALAMIFVALIIWRIFVLADNDKTKVDVARIHATKLAWSDINGTLPPEPDPAENNATLAGVDSNGNGIRDDVERAIYAKYKDNKRVAITMLQYAKELQMEFTEVRNSETLVAVMEEESRGFLCVGDKTKRKETESLVFNNDKRLQFREDVRSKYMVSWGIPNVEACDISF